MNRRQLIFMIIINALFSLLIALVVVWVVELRRPDPEELAALATLAPSFNLAVTAAPQQPNTASQGVATETAIPVPTAAATATEVAPAGDATEYTVQSGDTLLTIAAQFGISVDNIMDANGLDNPDFVFVGQRLVVPVAGESTGGNGQSQSTPQATPTLPEGEGLLIDGLSGAGNLETEMLSIVNESNVPYNLRGWSVGAADGPSYDFGELPIFPGASINLHTGAGADSSVDLYWNLQEPLWTPGATVRLLDAQNQVIDTYTVP